MTKTVYNIDEIKEKLEPIFRKEPIKKAILFGSYAKGKQRPNSDVDIVIDSEGKIRGFNFFGVLGDVAEALDKQVDLIEAYEIIEGGRVQCEIEETGVLIYERGRGKLKI